MKYLQALEDQTNDRSDLIEDAYRHSARRLKKLSAKLAQDIEDGLLASDHTNKQIGKMLSDLIIISNQYVKSGSLDSSAYFRLEHLESKDADNYAMPEFAD